MFSLLGRHAGDGWLQSGLPIYVLIILILNFTLFKKETRRQKLINAAFLLYFGLVIDLTYFPIPISEETLVHVQTKHDFTYSLVPFNDLVSSDFHRLIIFQMVLNILLFIPFGLLYPLTSFKSLKKHPIILGCLVSLSIELVQLITSYLNFNVRIFDTDDILMNTLGVTIGYILYRIIKKYVSPRYNLLRKQL